jgi:hypothetical protein
MNEISEAIFREAIRATHGAESQLVHRERVVEVFDGEIVWEGEVLVFHLRDHPEASECYAWEVDGQVTAVLRVPPVRTALDAVRASILAATDTPREKPL